MNGMVSRGRRTRFELRAGQGEAVARQAREDAARLEEAWANYVAAGQALAAITPCPSAWPSSTQDVAPTVCQKIAGHAPGEEDGGHRHRVLGTQVVVTW